jgi:uncharacterized protein YdeI (YjbR/CyaY-like superfamily)
LVNDIKKMELPYGENFKLQLFANDSKYGLAIPEEFEAILAGDWDAFEKFETLTPGKKRTLTYNIARFKNVQTKIGKSLIISENLKMGITDTKLLVKLFR